MSSHRLSAAVVVAAALGWGGIATADMSRNVITAFKGEMVITKGELPEGKTDKDTIAKIKTERLKELSGEEKGDVMYWHFHYTAFLTKAGASQLTVEFWLNDGSKEKKLAANVRLEGVDPKLTVLSSDISINEDDGLSKGKPYLLKVVTDKDVTVASTPLLMK